MGRLLDVPFYTVGLGAGPLTDDDARRQVRYLASAAEHLNVRDQESRQLLEDLGIDPNWMSVSPDTVYAVDLTTSVAKPPESLTALRAEGYRLIGLNLRHWRNAEQADWLDRFHAAICEVASTEQIAIVGLPMQLGGVHDEDALAAFATRLPESVPFVALGGEFGLDDYVAALRVVDGVIAMRLHAALLAHRCGKPVVGLSYDPKVRRHFDEVLASDLCTDISDPDAGFLDAIRTVLSLGGTLRSDTKREITALERRSTETLVAMCTKIAASPENTNVYRIPAEKPEYLTKPSKAAKVVRPATAAFEPMVARACKFRAIPERRLKRSLRFATRNTCFVADCQALARTDRRATRPHQH